MRRRRWADTHLMDVVGVIALVLAGWAVLRVIGGERARRVDELTYLHEVKKTQEADSAP